MADPLKVTCPYCGAKPRGRCMRNPGAYRHLLKFLPPHAARIRAADLIEHLRDRLSEETDPNAPQRRALGTGAMRRAMPDANESAANFNANIKDALDAAPPMTGYTVVAMDGTVSSRPLPPRAGEGE